MANAATIAAVGIRRNVPERAVVVALATALQESKLREPRATATATRSACSSSGRARAGARRSRSATRGTRPASSTTRLVKVRGWEEMRVTDAAQRGAAHRVPGGVREVGRRGRRCWPPRCLGRATGAVACTVPGEPAIARRRRGRRADQGPGGWTGAGWTRRRRATCPASRCRRPTRRPAGGTRTGWSRTPTEHGVKRVAFGDLQWTADEGSWTKAEGGGGAGQVVAEVFGDV